MPGWLACLLGLGACAMAWWMVPTADETALRLIEDGNLSRAAAVVTPQSAGQSSSATQVSVVSTPSQPEPLPDIELLKLLAVALHHAADEPSDASTAEEFFRLAFPVRDMAAMVSLVDKESANLSPELRQRYLNAAADACLAQSQPKLGALALNKIQPITDPTVAMKLLQALRWSDQHPEALAWLERYQSENPKAADDQWLKERVELLREVNRSAEALALLDKEMAARKDNPSWQEVWLYANCAEEAGGEAFEKAQKNGDSSAETAADLTLKAIPYIEAWLNRNLGEAPLSVSNGPGASELIAKGAAFLLYNNRGAESFDWRLKLARAGDAEALAWCLDTAADLQRITPMTKVLGEVGLEAVRPQHHLLAAKLLADVGDAQGARHCYQKWVDNHPDDLEATLELADVLIATSQFTEAAEVCQKAIDHGLSSPGLSRRLGDLLLTLGRQPEALPHFQKLAEAPNATAEQEITVMLADSLGNPTALGQELKRWTSSQPNPEPEYLEAIAMAKLHAEGLDMAVDSLKESAQRFPKSARLRRLLAALLIEQGQSNEAVALLAKSDLAADAEAMDLLLDAAGSGGDQIKVRNFLLSSRQARETPISASNDSLRQSLLATPESTVEAVAAAGAGPINSSGKPPLLAHSDALDHMRGEAESHFQQGNYQAARRVMDSFVSKKGALSPEDWAFYGSVLKAAGLLKESQDAFRRCLEGYRQQGAGRSTAKANSVTDSSPALE